MKKSTAVRSRIFVESQSLRVVCDTSVARTTGSIWPHAGYTAIRLRGRQVPKLQNFQGVGATRTATSLYGLVEDTHPVREEDDMCGMPIQAAAPGARKSRQNEL